MVETPENRKFSKGFANSPSAKNCSEDAAAGHPAQNAHPKRRRRSKARHTRKTRPGHLEPKSPPRKI